MKTLFCCVLLALATGCAYVRSTTTRQQTVDYTFNTNGCPVTVEKTTATVYALFEANSQVTKFANRAGATNGTYIAGINENAASTNLVAILQAIAVIAQHVP